MTDIQVLAGVCTECGVAAPHASVHIGWHEQVDRSLARLADRGEAILPVRSEGLDR